MIKDPVVFGYRPDILLLGLRWCLLGASTIWVLQVTPIILQCWTLDMRHRFWMLAMCCTFWIFQPWEPWCFYHSFTSFNEEGGKRTGLAWICKMKIENNFRVCVEKLLKRHQFRMLRACWTRIYIQPLKKAMPCRIENPLLKFLF